MKKDILIVDGYNVIFGWDHLKALSYQSLEHARMHLQDQLLNYGTFKGYEVILVFDGTYTKDPASVEKITSHFTVVFTDDGETADAYIEREVFLRKGKYTNVYVVTSDGDEQSQILGSGGLRIPARELKHQIDAAKEEERKKYTHSHHRDAIQLQRNEVFSNLDPTVLDALEKIRRGT